MDETPQPEGGMLAGVRRLFQTLSDVAANRLELFLVELKEERLRLFESLLLAAVAVGCAVMTLVLITLMALVLFWDTHRWLVLLLLTGAYAGAAAAAFVKLRSRLQHWQSYSASLEQIKKDCACFKKPN